MYEELVTLTGIEPAGYQFSSVQLGLSSYVFGLVQSATRAPRSVQVADVLPRCCPAATMIAPEMIWAGRSAMVVPTATVGRKRVRDTAVVGIIGNPRHQNFTSCAARTSNGIELVQ